MGIHSGKRSRIQPRLQGCILLFLARPNAGSFAWGPPPAKEVAAPIGGRSPCRAGRSRQRRLIRASGQYAVSFSIPGYNWLIAAGSGREYHEHANKQARMMFAPKCEKAHTIIRCLLRLQRTATAAFRPVIHFRRKGWGYNAINVRTEKTFSRLWICAHSRRRTASDGGAGNAGDQP